MSQHFAMTNKPITAVYSDGKGIEFVFRTEAGPRSLTLRGKDYWPVYKVLGGVIFNGNTIPLSGGKEAVTQFCPESIESFQLYEKRSSDGYSRHQRLAIRCRLKDGPELVTWVAEWDWEAEDGMLFHKDDRHLEGYAPVALGEIMDLTEKAELFCHETYKDALRIASMAHHGQLTPSGAPYTVHVISVAMEVIQSLHVDPLSFDEGTLAVCCALLHDTVEDTGLRISQLQDFGNHVVDGVRALTKDKTLEGSAAMHDSLARLKMQPLAVQRVKLADRITNLDPPPRFWDVAKCRTYQQEARIILDALCHASSYLAARLEQKIADYDRHIEEFSTHRHLVFLHAPHSNQPEGTWKSRFLLSVDKQDVDYFDRAKVTLKLSNALSRQRDIELFALANDGGKLGADYRVVDDEGLKKLGRRGYRQLSARQLYDEFLAQLDKNDDWIQRQIRQWADVWGVKE